MQNTSKMLGKIKVKNQQNLFFSFEDTLNAKHPLFILSNEINWELFETSFSKLYSPTTGRPAKPIRLLVGLLILKHLRNISDESVVEQWSENIYYQYFCGEKMFVSGYPCAASDLVHFRNRIGESGVELILKESIRINGKDGEDEKVSADTTVQEKNITYPTDSKQHRKIIKKCHQITEREGLPSRQNYKRVLKDLSRDQRFRNNPKNKKKAGKADKKVKTIAGRLVREVSRNLEKKLGRSHPYSESFELYQKVLSQKRNDKNKIYSLHEPATCCISKGKENKKYEFGNKASFLRTDTGVLVGALGFRNEFDGHTLDAALAQSERLRGKMPTRVKVDRGYRGQKRIGQVEILIPNAGKKNQTYYQKNKIRKEHHKRAAIEPIIGHLKTDHRLGRNFYKGILGDNLNILLAAAAFNFKRAMNKWLDTFCAFLCSFIQNTKTA